MTKKQERFSECSRLALFLAQQEAEKLGHSEIGTEHLLFGLIQTETSVDASVLKEYPVDGNQINTFIKQMSYIRKRKPGTKITVSGNVKRALSLAVDEARVMNFNIIMTGHLLLGILDLKPGKLTEILMWLAWVETERDIVFELLDSSNVDPDKLQQRLMNVLRQSAGSEE